MRGGDESVSMKIAGSSASFSAAFAAGRLTQLEWLDLCANELELDGVVFDVRHFPRTDPDYLAQLKKTATDLGLTVAALRCEHFSSASDASQWLENARELAAPLLVFEAPPAGGDAGAWNGFIALLRKSAQRAKQLNVTLALANAAGTLCPSGADIERAAKEVDSTWLRFAPDVAALGESDESDLLEKAAILNARIEDSTSFARDNDANAQRLIARMHRFRGFLTLDRVREEEPLEAFHDAVIRFARLRALVLAGVERAPMDVPTAIRTRRSAGRLTGAVPAKTIETLIELATHAPNHHLTEPWRFTVLRSAQRDRLGRLWGAAWADEQRLAGEDRERSIERDVAKLARAPDLVVVSVRTDDDPIVAEEDYAAAAAAVQNFLLAAQAMGLGATWRTGRMIRHPEVKRFLGLDPRDRIVATIYLGAQTMGEPPPRRRKNESIVQWME